MVNRMEVAVSPLAVATSQSPSGASGSSTTEATGVVGRLVTVAMLSGGMVVVGDRTPPAGVDVDQCEHVLCSHRCAPRLWMAPTGQSAGLRHRPLTSTSVAMEQLSSS